MYLTAKSVKLSFNLVEKLLKSVRFNFFSLYLYENSCILSAKLHFKIVYQ